VRLARIDNRGCETQARARSTHRSFLALLVLTAVLASAAPADAARPKKGGHYAGKTSQGSRIEVDVGRKGKGFDIGADRARTACARFGRSSFLFAVDVLIRVRRGGGFTSTSVDIGEMDLSLLPLLIDGRRRTVFDTTVGRLAGRFVSSRRVTGTWRFQSAIYDQSTFPVDDRPVDKCDTGVITWSARRR
jgi:hypothetical protein